jgi:hypothetical protein
MGAAPDYPTARQICPELPGYMIERSSTKLFDIATVCLTCDANVSYFFVKIARRRMAAVALAIRVYEIDHGHRPDDLHDLVPDYLAFVPADPFASDGQTFRYTPHAEIPLLYSVGPNGMDELGAYVVREGWRDLEAMDVPFSLKGGLPPPVELENQFFVECETNEDSCDDENE